MRKQDFPILKNYVFLDSASSTQKPKQVIKAVSEFYEKSYANIHRGVYDLSEKATEKYEEARAVIAEFIGAKTEEVIFTKGTTEGLNLLATSLGEKLERGDEVVLSIMEHHANLVPWQKLQKKGIVLKFIPLTDDYHLDMEKAKELINTKTKIVSVVQVSNVLGTFNDVKKLGELAHKVGAVMIVDAAQSVPHMKVDVNELGCDFLVFSGHKMLGPSGIGVLYGRRYLLNEMEPYQYGGDMIREVTLGNSTWNDLPWKFEAGTPPIAQAVGLGEAVKYLLKIGISTIEEHEKELTAYALDKLSKIAGLKIIGPLQKRGAVFSFVLEGIHPHDAAEILNRKKIAVRGGHHCAMPLMKALGISGTTRASFYLYNDKKDVDALVNGIKKVQEIFK